MGVTQPGGILVAPIREALSQRNDPIGGLVVFIDTMMGGVRPVKRLASAGMVSGTGVLARAISAPRCPMACK